MDSSTRVGSNTNIQAVKGNDPVAQVHQLRNERIKRVVKVVLIALGITLATLAVGFTFGFKIACVLGVGFIVAIVAGSLFFNGRKEQRLKPVLIPNDGSTPETVVSAAGVSVVIPNDGSTLETDQSAAGVSVVSVEVKEVVDEQKLSEFISDILTKIDQLSEDSFYEKLLGNELFKDEIKNSVDDYRRKRQEVSKKFDDEMDRLDELLCVKKEELSIERDKAIEEKESAVAQLKEEYNKLEERYRNNDPEVPHNALIRAGSILGAAEQAIEEIIENYKQKIDSYRCEKYDVPSEQVTGELVASFKTLKQSLQQRLGELLTSSN